MARSLKPWTLEEAMKNAPSTLMAGEPLSLMDGDGGWGKSR